MGDIDRFVPRPAQERMRVACLAAAGRGQRVVTALAFPATGKTAGAGHAANALYRAGIIDTVQVFTPRLNLCSQFEGDWERQRRLYAGPALGRIAARPNTPPLLRDGASGYAATYAALVAAQRPGGANIHLDVARSRRSLLILDEAHLLGMDEQGGTRAAAIVAELAAAAAAVLLMTGTPYREDGLPLLFARYSRPDLLGRRFLLADVAATYGEGVASGYLRPVEFLLIDGTADLAYIGAEGDEGGRLIVSEARGGLRGVLEHRGYWAGLVDRTVEQVRLVQSIDPGLCGLIAANNQAHARRIRRYLREAYPELRTLLAVSDDAGAQGSLEAFRRGEADVLITVRMAYIGYDHPAISVVCALTDYRAHGFLHQLFARGLRVMAGVPRDAQTLYAVVPDDPAMRGYADAIRAEAEEGLRARGRRDPEVAGSSGPPRVPEVLRAAATAVRAQGLDRRGDLTPNELAALARLQRSQNLAAVSPTRLGALLRGCGVALEEPGVAAPAAPAVPLPASSPPILPERQRELAVRRALRDALARCDRELRRANPAWPPGGSAAECRRRHGDVPVAACGVGELLGRLRWATDVWPREIAARALPGGG